MSATTTLGGTSSIKLPKDDRYVEKADNSTSGSSTKSVAIYDSPGGTSLTASVMGSSAPFNDISSKLRSSSNGAVLRDLKYGDVIGPLLTTRSRYFIRYNSSPFPGSGPPLGTGLVAGSPYINGDNDSGYIWYYCNNKNSSAVDWHYKLPRSMTIPNCVGGARGRYMELMGSSFTDQGKNNPPGGSPASWTNYAPFNNVYRTSSASNYEEVGTGFYLWTDKNGDYGPKNGHYGYGYAKDGAPPLPGAFITWMGPGYSHVAFIEAVYNFGSDDCYIIISESQWAVYREYGILTLERVNKTNFGSKTFLRWRESWDTKFIYTPLCDFSAAATGGTAFKQITLSYEAPPESQTEAYEEIKNIIATEELKVGDKVQIEQFGNEKSDGTGKKINRLLSIGYIKSIGAAGLPYKFEVVDKQVNGKLIGYYSREGLYKMAN